MPFVNLTHRRAAPDKCPSIHSYIHTNSTTYKNMLCFIYVLIIVLETSNTVLFKCYSNMLVFRKMLHFNVSIKYAFDQPSTATMARTHARNVCMCESMMAAPSPCFAYTNGSIAAVCLAQHSTVSHTRNQKKPQHDGAELAQKRAWWRANLSV